MHSVNFLCWFANEIPNIIKPYNIYGSATNSSEIVLAGACIAREDFTEVSELPMLVC